MYTVTNPATGIIEQKYDRESDAEIEATLAASHQRSREWDPTQRIDRANRLRRAASVQLERVE